MSMLEIHRSALSEIIVPYHHFLIQQKKYTRKLFGFVEGKDDPAYYHTQMEPLIDDTGWEIVLIEAGDPKGNRQKVLLLLDSIDWNRFSPKQTVFFVDRDLSDFFPEMLSERENLYITDEYSIENNIVNVYTLKRTLREVYNVNLFEEEFAIAEKLYNDGLQVIRNITREICCYYIALRRQGLKPSFGSLDISKICSIRDCKVTAVPEHEIIRYLNEKWECKCELIDLEQIHIEFDANNKNRCCMRGKYLLWYFVKFINEFCHCCDKIIPSMDKPITGVRELTEQYAISDLSARSKIPASLKLFVSNTYQQYILENNLCS